MSQAHNPFETMQGFSPPTVTQFSVFLDNRVGKLRRLLHCFSCKPYCTLHAISVHEASDHAVVRLITNDADETIRTLREQGFAYAETEVLVVEMDRDNAASEMCACLVGAELNILFMYPLFGRPGHGPAVALAVDDPTLAGQILRRKGYELLGEGDLAID